LRKNARPRIYFRIRGLAGHDLGVRLVKNQGFTRGFGAACETSRNKKENAQSCFEPLCNIFFTRGGHGSAAETGRRTGLPPTGTVDLPTAKTLETSK
jgi:hypothetical protein